MHAHFRAHASRPCNGKTHRKKKLAPEMSLDATPCRSMPFERLVFTRRLTVNTDQSARFDSFPQEPNDSKCIVQTVCVRVWCVCGCYSKHLFSKQSPVCPAARLQFTAAQLYRENQPLHRYGLPSSKLNAVQ
jgi:hypothetical protein